MAGTMSKVIAYPERLPDLVQFQAYLRELIPETQKGFRGVGLDRTVIGLTPWSDQLHYLKALHQG